MSAPAQRPTNLDKYQTQLIENAARLQKSIHYWQEWEIEYGGLVEEISLLDHDLSLDDLVGALLSQVFIWLTTRSNCWSTALVGICLIPKVI
jgi:hypothetical protein